MLHHLAIARNLLLGIPTSFTKYGDGELLCIAGSDWQNCDGHPYSPELGGRLRVAYHHLWTAGPNTFLGRWSKNEFGRDDLEAECGPRTSQLTDYELLLPNSLDQDLITLYTTIRELPARKVFVGPGRLAGAADMLRCEQLEVPLVNCFSHYDLVLSKLLELRPTVVIYTASMMSKCLIHEYGEQMPSSQLDVGSGFDALFVGTTRAGQPSRERCRQFFRTLL